MFLIAGIAVLAATVLSYGIARTVTRPLGIITATMRDMAATGDLTRRIPIPAAPQWEDEDARLLASTFNTMTDSIARFQREAAQRDRLSALGRLSTVVAHEIRNPLMIIKAALRRPAQGRDRARPTSRPRSPTSTRRSSGSTGSSARCSTSRGRSASIWRRPTSMRCARTRSGPAAPTALLSQPGCISTPSCRRSSPTPSGCGWSW
jgi:signal transduction histidine kinase